MDTYQIELGEKITMFTKPATFNEFLSSNKRIDEIYDALANEDLAEVAMTALKVLKETRQLASLTIILKSEESSERYRIVGNTAFQNNHFQQALMFYNQAILHAPKGSRQIKLGFSNRSALLFKFKAYNACLKDIETCFSMGCPIDIVGKLNRRKENAMALIATEDFTLTLLNVSVEKIINTTKASNPVVPCASRYVNFTGSVTPKVVASVDIKVGTVISCEKAYISSTESVNVLFACFYCQKQSLNLIPCENCCFAMFCNEECRKQCNAEYHKYECYVITKIRSMCNTAMPNLMLKTILKLRSQCKSWSELIDASYRMGLDRMKTSSYNEIYDCNYLYSPLNIRDDKPIIYGVLYNASFVVASLIHYFADIPLFYPKNPDEKQQAMRAVGRIMLFLSLHQTPMHIYQIITNLQDSKTHIHNLQNYGIFPFTGKLKKSCKPNLLVVNNNKEQILLTLRSIKCGEELTVSYQQHLLNVPFNRQKRNINNYLYSGGVCNCSLCIGSETLGAKGQLSAQQKKYYMGLNLDGIHLNLNTMHVAGVYKKLLQALDFLGDVPYSEEYEKVYKLFRRCIMFYEAIKGSNFVLELLQ